MITSQDKDKKIPAVQDERQTGKICFYDDERGFGFIRREGQQDIFFHRSQLRDFQAEIEQEIEFSVGSTKKGPCAIDITLVGGAK